MKTVKSVYMKAVGEREEYLERGRAAAELTLPYLLTREGHNSTEDLPTPYQSMGARGVNNLAAKMLAALFPINEPVFRLSIDDAALEELTQQEGQRAAVEEALNRIERIVATQMEGRAFRPSLFEALRHLIVVGNVLLYLDADTGKLRVLRLTNYIVKRAPDGTVMRIITRETVNLSSLPDSTREAIQAAAASGGNKAPDDDDELDLYTDVCRKGKKYEVKQEVSGVTVEGSEGSYPEAKLPWIAIRFNRVDGEHYGRGYVEEYIGDLISAEGLSQAVLEGAAGSARLLFLVNPNGSTDKEDLANAPNGEFVDGTAADVTSLQVNKGADMRVASEQIGSIFERLAFAFLLNSAVQRSGDRVTAQEIRYMAQELESALGGIYSILSQELQMPLVTVLMADLESSGKLPKLPKDLVQPVVVTGVEALGRGQDLAKLQEFIGAVAQLPEALQRINTGDLIKRIGAALGIDMKGLVRSEEEIQQQQQQAMAQQMAQNAAAPVAGQMAKAMTEGEPPQ